jgi:paraquat-inducible protein B
MQTQYITIEDLTAVVNLVDVVCTRGGLRGNELSPIARLRDVCEAEARHQTQERIKQQQETARQMAEQEAIKETSTENALANERQQRKELQQRVAQLQAQLSGAPAPVVGDEMPKAVKMSTPVVNQDAPKKPSRAIKMAQMLRDPADEFVAGDVIETTPSAVEDAANVMSDYVPPIDPEIAPIPPVEIEVEMELPETPIDLEVLMKATEKKAEQEKEDLKKELEDNLVSLNKKYEKTLNLLDDTLVIPDKKELNAMTKKTIEEVATGLGLEVNVKETKANMIKSFDKQAKKMVKELEASGSVESTTESEWIEATYIKE